MHQRKIKDIKMPVEEKSQQLIDKNKEKKLIKLKIEDLNKNLSLNEKENLKRKNNEIKKKQ